MAKHQDDFYDFWNKLPGPGHFNPHNFKVIPTRLGLAEAVRIGVTEYLGVRWVLDESGPDSVVVSRTDRPLTVRLSRTYRDKLGDPCYALWARVSIPDDRSFAYVVGLGTFKQAIEREIHLHVGYRSKIVPEDEGLNQGTEMMLAVEIHHPPEPSANGDVARWMIWAALAMQWVSDSIEANPNP